MEFAWCTPGKFLMGSLASEKDRNDDESQHEVTLTKGYYIGVYPVTRGQFGAFVAATKHKTEAEASGGGWGYVGTEWKQDKSITWRTAGGDQTDDHPVKVVSHNDAVAFCQWAAEVTKQAVRLPTEAEWECACRAGSIAAYHGGDTVADLATVGWYLANSVDRTHRVGEKRRPNSWNLHDMHGNVWEWCADWYDAAYYASSPTDDPKGPQSGSGRVCRGGSWFNFARSCRSACRFSSAPGFRRSNLGFRVAVVPSGQ